MPEQAGNERGDLRADCSQCVGLCCVALPFARSTDFAIDKPAGTPCLHLRDDDRCSIHARLRPEGFPGCQAFDCFGAGQQVVQHTFGGRTWRDGPSVASAMDDAFVVLQAVHEMRWYLADSVVGDLEPALRAEVDQAAATLRRLSGAPADELVRVDVQAIRRGVGALLDRVSVTVRAGLDGPDLRRADLTGRRLRSLRGADLRGALLLGADLRDADLRRADLLGTDLRGADLRGADLSDAVFVTTPQLAAARGNQDTRTPQSVDRPTHWS